MAYNPTLMFKYKTLVSGDTVKYITGKQSERSPTISKYLFTYTLLYLLYLSPQGNQHDVQA